MISDKKHLAGALIILSFLWFAHPRLALAEQPMDRIRNAIEGVSEVLQDVSAKQGANKDEAVKSIREIVLPSFDFAEMARRSLGDQWKTLDGRQSEFVGAFTEYVESAYMSTLASYRGEKVVYLRESVSQDLAQVDTQVVARKGNPLSVNYRLHLTQGDWKVYDVVVDNISLVSNFRAQFKRILATASLDDLLKKLREKSEKPA
jgi:phospholipid transport system substrate-binding protein